MKVIFEQSIDLFGKGKVQKEVKEIRVGTTNITFPTDRKMIEKVIGQCRRIAGKEGIKLKRT